MSKKNEAPEVLERMQDSVDSLAQRRARASAQPSYTNSGMASYAAASMARVPKAQMRSSRSTAAVGAIWA